MTEPLHGAIAARALALAGDQTSDVSDAAAEVLDMARTGGNEETENSVLMAARRSLHDRALRDLEDASLQRAIAILNLAIEASDSGDS